MKEKEIISLLYQLQDMGVTGVNIGYEGGGDDGCIEQVAYTSDELSDDNEEAFDQIHCLDMWGESHKNLKDLHGEVSEMITSLVDNYILQNIEDWWNNEGGYGNLCVMIPSGRYKVFNNIRYTNVETYLTEGELMELQDDKEYNSDPLNNMI
jgi:hypothetical protein